MNDDTNNTILLVDNNQNFDYNPFTITNSAAETNDTGNQIQIIPNIANENTSAT